MDPEEARFQELVALVRTGEAEEAERQEIELYVSERPERHALVLKAAEEGNAGGQWLARYEREKAVAKIETSPFAKAEQRVGVGLMVVGGIAGFFFPPALIGVLAGGALLSFSVLRTKLQTLGKDPYDDIEQ